MQHAQTFSRIEMIVSSAAANSDPSPALSHHFFLWWEHLQSTFSATLGGLMLKLKLQYFGHLMQRAHTHWKGP